MFRKIDWLTILWAIFILVICGIPGDRIPPVKGFGELIIDKIVHIGVFAVLSFCWGRKTTLHAGVLVLLCSLYGALIEVLQVYVFINRSGDVLDWIADTAGAVLGIAIFLKMKIMRK